MNANHIKTVFLLGLMSGLFLFMGYLLGGQMGVVIALVLSIGMNFYAYFQSDKYVLKAHQAIPLDPIKYKQIYQLVEELASEYKIPMPKLWLIPTNTANAFATGRNPEHSHVAVTEGILKILNQRELRGVLAHELGHISNRDILISTIAVTLAGAIGILAYSMRFQAMTRSRERGGGLAALLIALILPVAASIIHLGISRSREYLADESGACVSEDPLALASALEKLEASIQQTQPVPKSSAQATTASLFIVYPFSAKTLNHLFSTHPPMEERIARLKEMARRY